MISQESKKEMLKNFAEGGPAKHLTNELVSHSNHASKIEPNFPDGTKVKLIHFDPATWTFTESPEEIIHRKNGNELAD